MLASTEDFLARGEFTFGGNEDFRIEFSVVRSLRTGGDTGRVGIKVSYPFDRSTSEYVSEDIEIPRSEFDRMIDELIGGYDSAEYSDGGVHFGLIRTESGGVKFGFRKEEYCLDGSCVIDGITL